MYQGKINQSMFCFSVCIMGPKGPYKNSLMIL